MEEVKKKKVGIITLAVGLIIIGSLWTLQNIYPMPWIPKVVTLWPVLLILYGLELIITKLLYEEKDGVHVTIDVGIIILLIFFVVILGGISVVQSILPQIGIHMGLYPEVKVPITQEWAVEEDIEKVEIRQNAGEISIMPSEENKIFLEANISMTTEDEETFKEWAQEAFHLERKGNTLYIEPNDFKGKGFNENHLSADTIIYLPKQLYAKVENQFGDVYVEGLQKGAFVKVNNGDIRIQDIKGTIDATNQFGDIDISNIQGKVTTNNSNGRIELKNISESVLARNQFGDIEIQEVLKGIDVKNDNGNIAIDIPTIQGDIDIDNQFGDISLRSSKYDNVYIKASTKFGDINSDIDLESENNEMQSVQKEVTIGKGTFKIVLKNDNGNIAIEK